MTRSLGYRRIPASLLFSLVFVAAGCSSNGDSTATNVAVTDGGGKDASVSDAPADGKVGDAAVFDGGGKDSSSDVLAPFTCDLPEEKPSLEPQIWQHPHEPAAGQDVTFVFKSGNTKPTSAPKLVGELINRDGTRTISDYTLVGGANAFYYVTFSPLAQGENCMVLRNGDKVEMARKIVAPAPTPTPKGNGVWKISSNHQWTCDEEPGFGNFIRAKVLDENDKPVAGAIINIRWIDDVVYPVPVGHDGDKIKDDSDDRQPKSMTTNDKGEANMVTKWGEGNRTPIDGKSGMIVFLLSVDGGASDVATEITSALWEETYEHCNYCNKGTCNVYGHWSYTVTFKRDPTANRVCVVGTDHAGQKKCPFTHFYHDPNHPSCLPVVQ